MTGDGGLGLHGEEETIYADKAYADQGRKERVEADDIEWRGLRKARRGKRLSCADLSFNRKSNRTRARVGTRPRPKYPTT